MIGRNSIESTRNDFGGMERDVGYHRGMDTLEQRFRQTSMSSDSARPVLEQRQYRMSSSPAPAQEKNLGGFRAINDYLITPPQDVNHSFSSDGDGQPQGFQDGAAPKLPPIQSHSPPISPESKALPSIATATGFPDPPLYPDDHSNRPSSRTPLFSRDSQSERRASRIPTSPSALPYPANLGVTSPAEAYQYWSDRMAELNDLKNAMRQLPSPKVSAHVSIDENGRRMLDRIEHPTRVVKPRGTPRQPTKPKATAVASSPKVAPRAPPQRKRTPKARTSSEVSDAISAANKANKHTRAAPSKKVEDSELKWFDLPDYSPPTSSLETMDDGLRVKWTGATLDIADDPDRAYLHPQEQHIAIVLRLHCAQYLFCKRKIFAAKLQSLKDGKNFGKTAAQGACPIDVNKASQLWDAFNRAGWFEKEWFQQWL